MKIIYVSTLISRNKINYIINNSNNKPLQSVQKYHRLLCEGLVKNGINVKTLSTIPISRTISKRFIWFEKKETENGVKYNYLPFINVKIVRQLFIGISIFLKIIKECLKNKKQKVFICDILNTTISSVTLLLSKVLKFKCIAIITDLPRDIGSKYSISKKINENLQSKYDGYILLTEEMNNVVNIKNRPYIVIEGIADINMQNIDNTLEKKHKSKVCMYAGGLYEKYGLKMFINAFMHLKTEDTELHLYGSGALEEYIKSLSDKRIKYYGVVTNDIIVEEEVKATLLINPRPTKDDYTKYSFPSKNMEYMASGTAVLTTKLPGMPKEYYDYVYLIEDNSLEGMKQSLKKVLNKTIDEINKQGKKAKIFVMQNKNNVIQAYKVINLCEKIRRKNEKDN